MKKNLIFIILFSIVSYYSYKYTPEFYFCTKYLIGRSSVEPLFSIVYIFLFINYFISGFYNIILNRYNIIVRLGYKKYKQLITKKILIDSIAFIIVNILIDAILFKIINFKFVIINSLLIIVSILFIKKNKDYDRELLILIIIIFIIRFLLVKTII